MNLVVNAVQAMSAVADRVREVLITTAQARPNGVLVGLSDFGSGLDPASIGRIFDPFYSTKSGALEMGLSVCRSIVATLGGRLSVKLNIPRCQRERAKVGEVDFVRAPWLAAGLHGAC